MLTDAQKVAISLTFKGEVVCSEDDTEGCKDAPFSCCYLCPHAVDKDGIPGCHSVIDGDAFCPSSPDNPMCELHIFILDILWRTNLC